MIAQTIKTLLGEELAAQVEAALAGKGAKGMDVELVVGNDGSFIPVETYRLLQKTTALKLALGDSVYDPEDIIARLDLAQLELDDEGKLASPLEELIAPIRESKPYLFRRPAPRGASSPAAFLPLDLQGAAPGHANTQGGDMNALLLNDAFGLKGE